VALVAIYPVMFLEIFKSGADSVAGTQLIAPMVCMQAANVTSKSNAGTSGASPPSSVMGLALVILMFNFVI
jgi:hypothetical protein